MTTVIDYGSFRARLDAAGTTGARWRLLDAFQREWGLDVEDESGIGWIDDNRERLDELRADQLSSRTPASTGRIRSTRRRWRPGAVPRST